MPASKFARVECSITSRILATLVSADDIVEEAALRSAVANRNIDSALWWLVKVGAIERIDQNGARHFFATPECDRRQQTFDERKKEDLPRCAKSQRKTLRTFSQGACFPEKVQAQFVPR